MPHFIFAVALSMLLHWIFWVSDGQRLWRSQPSFPVDIAFTLQNVLLNFLDVLPLGDRLTGYQFLDIVWAVRVEMAFYIVVFGLTLGGALSRPLRFGLFASAALLPLGAGFILAVVHKAPAILSYVPYFAFGGALFYVTRGKLTGWCIMLLAIPAMVWQCVDPSSVRAAADGRAVGRELLLLTSLLLLLALCAFSRGTTLRQPDRYLGNLTYPLYLYHEDVLVFLLLITSGYSYGVFAAGIVASLLLAAAAYHAIDPRVNRWRDVVRGRRVEPAPSPSLVVAPVPLRDVL
jgi:peptidoglycan/LPS O-acetylase OafA/YrhL